VVLLTNARSGCPSERPSTRSLEQPV